MPPDQISRQEKAPLAPGRQAVMLFFLATLIFIIYSNSLRAPFLFDDTVVIVENPRVHLTRLAPGDILSAATWPRPLGFLSFALNYYAGRFDVLGYHLVNVGLHIITAFLLFFFIKATFETPVLLPRYGQRTKTAFAVALLWAVHPIQTQSVSFISQRMNSLASLFFVASLLLFVRGRLATAKWPRRALFGGCAVCGLCALGSKEIAVTLPFFLICFEWFFFQDLSGKWLARNGARIAGLVLFFLLAAMAHLAANPVFKRLFVQVAAAAPVFYFLYRAWMPAQEPRTWLNRNYFWFVALAALGMMLAVVFFVGDPVAGLLYSYKNVEFTLGERVLTEFRVLWLYVSLILFPLPFRLNLCHEPFVSTSIWHPATTMAAIAATLGLLGLAVALAKKERLVSFCIFWFLGNLVIESSVLPLNLVFEHRLYLPSMMAILALVLLAARFVEKGRAPAVLVCMAALACAAWTYERNNVWTSDISLWQDCVAKSPKSTTALNNLGFALVRAGQTEEAMNLFRKVMRIDPVNVLAYYNMGQALKKTGKIKESIWYFKRAGHFRPEFVDAHLETGLAMMNENRLDEALYYFQRAKVHAEDDPRVFNNMGAVFLAKGDIKTATEYFFRALRVAPDFAQAHENMGIALMKNGLFAEATDHFKRVLQNSPNSRAARYNLASNYVRRGMDTEAIPLFMQSFTGTRQDAQVHNGLAAALVEMGRFQEAMKHYEAGLALEPDDPALHKNLGAVLAHLGRREEAMSHYRASLAANPSDPETHHYLAVTLTSLGRLQEAESQFKLALALNPDDLKIQKNLGLVLARQGRYEEAARLFQAIVAQDPKDKVTARDLDIVLARMQRIKQNGPGSDHSS